MQKGPNSHEQVYVNIAYYFSEPHLFFEMSKIFISDFLKWKIDIRAYALVLMHTYACSNRIFILFE